MPCRSSPTGKACATSCQAIKQHEVSLEACIGGLAIHAQILSVLGNAHEFTGFANGNRILLYSRGVTFSFREVGSLPACLNGYAR